MMEFLHFLGGIEENYVIDLTTTAAMGEVIMLAASAFAETSSGFISNQTTQSTFVTMAT